MAPDLFTDVNLKAHGTAPKPLAQNQPIAIVGVSCKFAGEADSASGLWNLCKSGKTAWSLIPPERFDINSSLNKNVPQRNHVIGGHFFHHDIASFDAGFFNLSADVASAMDPQLRLLLESVYEATENAGIPLESIAGSNTSVFTGCWGKDYHELQARDPDFLPPSFLTGNGTAMLSNRISHFFDLQGASMSIDSGCSSGLVAMHQACRSIQWGDSDMSIVTASSVMLSPDLFTTLSSLSMAGADGKCYAWDARAQGYGRGEGVATLILKPLEAAIKNGDYIHALVRGTGLGQDGKTKTLTSPSVAAQIRLIEQCYERAGLDLSETGYVEAHMTGTLIGDVTEAEALAMTFGKNRSADDPVLVGSVKTNIGHTEAVSGLAAIIKVIWALKMRQIPPNLNYETPNPDISLQEWNLKVPIALTEWPKNKPLRASINNFGYGGTNSHIILESALPGYNERLKRENQKVVSRDRIFVVSAKDSVALEAMMQELANHVLSSVDDDMLGDLAFTLSEKRSRFPLEVAVQASSRDELANGLRQWPRKPRPATRRPRLGFVFNGQGAQWHAMGRELIEEYPVFGLAIQKADGILKTYGASWSLRDELMRDAESTRVSEVDLSQPITVALQICLVDLLRSWNITPSAVTSHSSGEIAAAYAVGRLSFDEALGVAYWRGELGLMNKRLLASTGGMMAVRLAPQDVTKYLIDISVGHVVVACINSPSSVTLSGDIVALCEVKARLEADGFSPRKLDVPLAYHSHHMLSIGQEYTERLKEFLSNQSSGQKHPEITFISPVTGSVVPWAEALTAEHWTLNLTKPVLFSQALERMCFEESGSLVIDMIVEVGAHSTLAGPIRQILQGREISYASCLQRSVNAVKTMQNLACGLVNRGHPVSLHAINAPKDEILTLLHDLPSYAWNHTSRYWTESRISKELRHRKFQPHELLGFLLPGDNGISPTWRNLLRVADIPWLVDYQVDSRIIFPTAAYASMVVEAVRLMSGFTNTPCQFELRDVQFLSTLIIPESSPGVEIQLNLRPTVGGCYEFTIFSLGDGDNWLVNCKGQALAKEEQTVGVVDVAFATDFLGPHVNTETTSTVVEVDSLYSRMAHTGICYGPSFRNIAAITTAEDKSVTDFVISNIVSEAPDGYVIHPTTLSSIFQSTYNSVPEGVLKAYAVLPLSIEYMSIHSNLSKHSGDLLQARTKTQVFEEETFVSEVKVIDQGQHHLPPSFHMDGLIIRALPRSDIAAGDEHSLYQQPSTSTLEWELDAWTGQFPLPFKDSIRISLGDEHVAFERKMMRLSYYLIHDAVQELKRSSHDETAGWQRHQKSMFDWMKEIVFLGESGLLAPRSRAWSRAGRGAKQILVDEMNASMDASPRLVIRVGKSLTRIVRGEIAPLEVMMEGNLLNQYYLDSPRLKDRTYKHLFRVAQILGISRPGANILEIGAGTGGATDVVLKAFSSQSRTGTTGSFLGHYTFTDVSSGFFESARAKFACWADLMEFKPLDIEADLEGQLFGGKTYDIVVASLALHATRSLHKTMSNVRKLLKPGGKLILVETTTDRLDMQLVFGAFPGWWIGSEPDRTKSPNVSLEAWDKVLRDALFTGNDFEIGDCEEAEFQCTSLIISTAATTASYPSSISVVQAGKLDSSVLAWSHQLVEAVRQRIGVKPRLESIEDVQDWTGKVCIFMADMNGPYLYDMKQPDFDKLRGLLVSCQGLLWLSCGGSLDAEKPLFALTHGLMRTLRQEDMNKRFVQLEFTSNEHGDNWTGDKICHVVDVFQHNFDTSQDSTDQDNEYAVKDSMLYVPRLYPRMNVQKPSELSPLQISDATATYLVVGGMGGIGRAIVEWMVENGAKNVLVVSRTAGKHVDVAKLSAAAHLASCNLQFRSCDISNEEDFLKLLADCSNNLPPIRGVVNAAMILDDTVLERMTWNQWSRVTQTKVAVSMNLHTHIPDLQFFVLLSSVTGVAGHMSQANYAAGNSFQDALARHRTALGRPAVVLDFGAVDSVGWVARQGGSAEQEARKRIERLGFASVSVRSVLELLDAAIRDPLRDRPAASQIIVGLSHHRLAKSDAAILKHDRRLGTLLASSERATKGKTKALVEATAGAVKDKMALLLAAVVDDLPTPDLMQLILNAVRDKLAVIFNVDSLDIDPDLPLSQYGVDSLVAVDVRNWLANRLKARVSVSDIVQAPSLLSFATLVATNSELFSNLLRE